jgi:hypothetical protein
MKMENSKATYFDSRIDYRIANPDDVPSGNAITCGEIASLSCRSTAPYIPLIPDKRQVSAVEPNLQFGSEHQAICNCLRCLFKNVLPFPFMETPFQRDFALSILWKCLFKNVLPFPFCGNAFSGMFRPFHFVETAFQECFEVSPKWVKQKIK